ncbi:MAG TPA: hypothetical protein VFO40_22805 [Chthoniobacterales bacterium]|nr:hypothetical protein [Chthoniobacterales bacterium]
MDTITTAVPYIMVLLVAGMACGFINTLASSGPAISLPMLLTLGSRRWPRTRPIGSRSSERHPDLAPF